MSLAKALSAAMLVAIFHGACVESYGIVEMISDYAKISKNAEKPTIVDNNISSSNATTEPTTEQVTIPKTDNTTFTATVLPDYDDFDDLQEEEERSLNRNPSVDTMMKYFNGIVSLLALMNKFAGRLGQPQSQNVYYKTKNEPRDRFQTRDVTEAPESRRKTDADSGKHFQETQDRFDFSKKKFKYQSGSNGNMIDQQYQPVENYPPYNPLTANSAETYNQDEKKTSYDSDLMQYDGKNNGHGHGDADVEVQQSYSYEIPYETPKQVKQPTFDLTTDDGSSWNSQDIHPVYHSWMSSSLSNDHSNQNIDSYQPWLSKPVNDIKIDSYQVWNSNYPKEEKPIYQPWKIKPVDDPKPTNGDLDSHHPWKGKPPSDDFPTYHHDFPNDHHSHDHHFEFHEVDHHPMDEDRVSKKPYSYYFLGRKLWYIPLLFSVYFIIYVGALVLKSVARHKIQFPDKLWELHENQYGHVKHRRHRKIDEATENFENAIENIKNKFM